MNAIDISTFTLPELKDLQTNVATLIETRKAETVSAAKAQIAEIARHAGINLKELMTREKPAGNKAPVKFRDPSNSKNQWTGRGRAPHWAAAMKDAGTLDSARV